MRLRFGQATAALALAVVVAGCTGGSTDKGKPGAHDPGDGGKESVHTAPKTDDAASIKANLAKLGPEDRKLAEAQRYCAVETKNPLGSMGVPYRVMVQGEPVFLCCDGCETRAKAHADRTLERVKQFRAQAAKSGE